jgi:hypothetical protein
MKEHGYSLIRKIKSGNVYGSEENLTAKVKFSFSEVKEKDMNKSFLFTGIASLLLVVVLIWTCPTEDKFYKYLEKKYDVVCNEGSFTCTENGTKLELAETKLRNGVFFITIEKKFQDNNGKTKTAKGFGMLGTFWAASWNEN